MVAKSDWGNEISVKPSDEMLNDMSIGAVLDIEIEDKELQALSANWVTENSLESKSISSKEHLYLRLCV